MLGYELSIHEIVPLEVFLFRNKKLKNLKRKKNSNLKKKAKRRKGKENINKRSIQLISFTLWLYFNRR